MSSVSTRQQRKKRHRRVRSRVVGTAQRPRVSVFRSNRGISVQLIDDTVGNTIAAVNWTEPELRSLKAMAQAERVGALLAERATAKGVDNAVFDRGGYKYHGRVKAVAENARAAGLKL